jgi:hypothetical protein
MKKALSIAIVLFVVFTTWIGETDAQKGVFEIDSLESILQYEYHQQTNRMSWCQYITYKYRFHIIGGNIGNISFLWQDNFCHGGEINFSAPTCHIDTIGMWMISNHDMHWFPCDFFEIDSILSYIVITGAFYERVSNDPRDCISYRGKFEVKDTVFVKVMHEK